VINWLNASGGAGGELPPEPELTDFLLDVSDDGRASAIDALLVINELNRRASQQVGEEGSSSTSTTSTSSSSGTAAGEAEGDDLALLAGPGLAARYYATSPLHVSDIPGVDPASGGCTCGQCAAINELALVQVGQPTSVADADAADDDEPIRRKSKTADGDVHLDDSLLSALAE
jgi:hypothetical protein